MPDLKTGHLTVEEIAAFAEGNPKDTHHIESHVDACADCASEVVIARQIRQLDLQGLIPSLTSEKRAAQREKLDKYVQQDASGKLVPKATNPAGDSTPSSIRTRGIAPLFGALGGAFGLGKALQHPTPSPGLAGTDSHDDKHAPHQTTEPNHAPDGPATQGADAPPSGSETTDSHHHDVTDGPDSASHSMADHSAGTHETPDFLERAQAMIDSDPTTQNVVDAPAGTDHALNPTSHDDSAHSYDSGSSDDGSHDFDPADPDFDNGDHSSDPDLSDHPDDDHHDDQFHHGDGWTHQ